MSSVTKKPSLHGEPHIQGVAPVSSGVIEAYDFDDVILDARCDTEQGAFHLWAMYQSEVDRDVLLELVTQARKFTRQKQKKKTVVWQDIKLPRHVGELSLIHI